MKHTNKPFSKKWRHFNQVTTQLNQSLQNGQFQQLPQKQQQRLSHKLKQLYQQLIGVFSIKRLQKALAASAILLGLNTSTPTFAQGTVEFAPPKINPFGMSFTEAEWVIPTFADIDGDGDLDLFVTEYLGNIRFLANIGTAKNPVFDAPKFNVFNITVGTIFSYPQFVDIDKDGDLDLLASDVIINEEEELYMGIVKFYENIGTATTPNFDSPRSNPFGIPPFDNLIFSTFTDIDDDGDQDLFIGEYDGTMHFLENLGSPEAAKFDAPKSNPWGIQPTASFTTPTFADLDLDGDQDLVFGQYNTNTYSIFTAYFENTGTAKNPNFVRNNTLMFPSLSTYAFPTFADIDADGDQDLFIGDYANDESFILYVENTTIVTGLTNTESIPVLSLNSDQVTEQLHIKATLTAPNSAINVEIVNLSGQQIYQQTLSATHQQIQAAIPTQQLTNGIYLIHLQTPTGTATQKFLKQ